MQNKPADKNAKDEIKTSNRFEVLDSFRGLAAICVVIFHMHYANSITELNFFRGSHLFVEFFFVLSGFVLSHGYTLKSDLNFKSFLVSRTFRLFPLHIFMLIIFILLEIGKLIAYNSGFVFNNIPFAGNNGINEILPNILLLQSWLPNTISLSWNYPSWSISIEYYMYIIFFATLLFSHNKILIWLTISLVAFYLIGTETKLGSDIFRGLSCFFAGVITYHLHNRVSRYINLKPIYFHFIEFCLILSVIIALSLEVEYKSIIASFIFCVVVFFFALEKGFVSVFLKKDIFLYFGKLSYSIYLVHAAILFCTISMAMILQKVLKVDFTTMVCDIRVIDYGNAFINNFIIFVIVVGIILVSHFTHRHIEAKGQSMGKRLNMFLSNKKNKLVQ